jgi:hypothetical protein
MIMKHTFLISLIAFLLGISELKAFQDQSEEQIQVENFLISTNQDLLLTGDRLWFAIQLLSNHDDYKFSKLAYFEIYGPEGSLVHQEKLLLDQERMAYGDFILPENGLSGVYTLYAYTKWMTGYDHFPIAQKHILVHNPKAVQTEPSPKIFTHVPPFEKGTLMLFHTGDKAEPVEIQDESGKTLAVIEEVPGMSVYYTQVELNQKLQLLYQGQQLWLEPYEFLFDPKEMKLQAIGEEARWAKVITHTDWQILEELNIENLQQEISLSKERYDSYPDFSISVLDRSGEMLWNYKFSIPSSSGGNINTPNSLELGKGTGINLSGFASTINGLLWVKIPEPEQAENLMQILEDPNWSDLEDPSRKFNLAYALSSGAKNKIETEYVPLLVYRPWSIQLSERYPELMQKENFTFSVDQLFSEQEVNRKIFHEHFDFADQVSGLQSPFTSDITYQVGDYVAFNDLESFIKEIVVQAKFKKIKGSKEHEIRILDITNEKLNFKKKPLILVDFYEIKNLDELLNIPLNSIDRVEVFYDRKTIYQTNLGEPVGDGLLAFFTKNNDFALKNNIAKDRYILKDVNVSRKLPDQIAPARFDRYQVHLSKPQFFDPKIKFYRGRAKTAIPYLDYPGSLVLDFWTFEKGNFQRFQKNLKVN